MNSLFGAMGATGGISGSDRGVKSFSEKIPKGYKAGAIQQFTPEQLELFKQLFSNVGPESFLAKLAGGDQSQFEEIEAPALRQFSQLQGNLASRFSGMGMGARRSSGFQNAMTSASSDFAQQLQSQRQGLQRQAILDLMGLSSDLLQQKPFQRTLTEKPKSWWQQLLSGAAGGIGSAVGNTVGGFL